ncbi:MAG TPA: ATP-binding protein [Burkholderiales bacterium]|nr:ATP-binding protein [Burkholderiales bacterium]
MVGRIAHSIRGKLLLLIVAVTFIALFVSAIALVVYEARTYRERWVQDLQTQGEILGVSSVAALAFDDKTAAKENLELLRARPAILAAAIYDEHGALFASFHGNKRQQVPERLQSAKDSAVVEGGRVVLIQRINDRNTYQGAVYLVATYGLYERIAGYGAILAAVMLLSLALAVLVGSWLQKKITEPLLAVTDTAHQVIETRDFSLRVSKTTSDEIGYLVDAFNGMLAEIGTRADALIAADAMKDQFLATLAHELRNPLAAISNAVHILKVARDNPKMLDAAQGMMERQLKQLVRLVDDLLDVSRITTGKLTLRLGPVSLVDVLGNAVEIARPMVVSRHHDLSVTLPDAPIRLTADATRLAQVFSNLLNNAAKYTDEQGRIELTTRTEEGSVVVQITDNGIGIAPELLPRVFDMFTQADTALDRQIQTGLGVGLALAKRLVELHGGTIEAHSEGIGRGSRFIVRLPSLGTAAVAPAAAKRASTPVVSALRVVVADDNLDFAATLAIILRDLGHDVRVAHDGVQAVSVITEFAPDIAFVDIGLPGMSGYDVARRLRADGGGSLVLIAVTGYGQETDKARTASAGFDAHIVKPLEPFQLAPVFELVAARRDLAAGKTSNVT